MSWRQEMMSSMRTISIGEIHIATREIGQGELLLMIMGYAGTMDTWEPIFLDALAQRFHLVCFDNRGTGGTSASQEPFTIDRFAQDGADLLTAMGFQRAHVLGYSMGAQIALELALTRPEKVNKLILYGSQSGGEGSVPISAQTLATLLDTSGAPQEIRARLISLFLPQAWMERHPQRVQELLERPAENIEPTIAARQRKAMEEWVGAWDRLEQIQAPTLLVSGIEDRLTPVENARRMAQRIAGAWLAQFEGAGHGLMYQEPTRLARLIATFLE